MREIQEIIDYYNKGVERDRLLQGPSQVERLRTQELVLRHLLSVPLKIADVGGGAGFYSFWLAEMGHEVHFIDAAPANLETARHRNDDSQFKVASLQIGDARELPYEDNSFDALLMLGPLYHLIEKSDRVTAIREGHRILKKGGIIFCATISRFASMLHGFFYSLIQDPDFVKIMQDDLQTGIHKNPTSKDYFTTCYYHTVDEVTQEVEAGGFSSVKWYAVEGLGCQSPDHSLFLSGLYFHEHLL